MVSSRFNRAKVGAPGSFRLPQRLKHLYQMRCLEESELPYLEVSK